MNSALNHNFSNPLRQLLLLLAVIFLLAACGQDKEPAIPIASRVLALGDSLTAGYGVNVEQAWPNLLAGKTGWTIINGGVSGDTSGGALQRLPSLLEEHDPALVLVALGGNDMLRHQPQAETINNLQQIIALIRAHGAKPVLLATPQPSLAGAAFHTLSAADFYRQVADAQHVPLIEDAIADVLSNPDLKVDALHPNAAGHALLAEKILEGLKEIGFAG
ncbi:MAG: arylesterase [Sideroxydans sp.]|nr:arylesterase [Sideroxydans sp.]